MRSTRLVLFVAFGLSLATACGSSSGGLVGNDASSDTRAGSCSGAMVQCGHGVTYQRCTDSLGGCYIDLSSGTQLSCPSCTECPQGDPCTEATNEAGGGGSGGSGGSGEDGGVSDAAAACTADIDGMTCIACCQALYPSGVTTFGNAVVSCACTTPGMCKSQCASTFCDGKTPVTMACETCVDNTLSETDASMGDCVASVSNACEADPECVNYLNCGSACP